MGLSFWRNTIAILILLPFVYRPLLDQWTVIRNHWKMLALLAFLLWVGGNGLLFFSLQYTTAVNAAVINSVEPVFIIMLASLLFRDRFSWPQAAGIALSLLGVLVLISHGSFQRLVNLEFNPGDLIVTCAYLAWALYAVLLRTTPAHLDGRVAAFILISFGSLFLLPLYIGETLLARPMPITVAAVLWSIGLAVFPAALGVLFYNQGIRHLGAVRAGQFLHLIPAFTVILAIGLLGESFETNHMAGIAFILAGLYVSSLE